MADQENFESQEEVQAPQEPQPGDSRAADTPPADDAGQAPADPEAESQAAAADAPREGEQQQGMSEQDAEEAMLKMLNDLPEDDSKPSAEDIDFGSTNVARAEFQHLSEPAAHPEPRNIDLLMDVSLPISIELGRTKMSISDILGLGPGSVVELNKLAGEPVDVLVNRKIVAKGEVVVIDENFGVRITQLMTPEERLKLLSDEQ